MPLAPAMIGTCDVRRARRHHDSRHVVMSHVVRACRTSNQPPPLSRECRAAARPPLRTIIAPAPLAPTPIRRSGTCRFTGKTGILPVSAARGSPALCLWETTQTTARTTLLWRTGQLARAQGMKTNLTFLLIQWRGYHFGLRIRTYRLFSCYQ